MNKNKIAIIICSNDTQIMKETRKYIDKLYIPSNMEIEVIIIVDAHSIAEGYNRGMMKSDAKYKLYMHQDVFIINKNIIKDMLIHFESNEKLGMLGVIGCKQLPLNGIWWEGEGIGMTLQDNLQCVKLLEMKKVTNNYELVQAIDGQLMITQYDIPWREDICRGWHFYDTSQSIEFIKKGYEVGVVAQNEAWVIHECGFDINIGYEEERNSFLEEYKGLLNNQNDKSEERIAEYINCGNWEDAKKHMKIYIESIKDYTDTMAILEASINFNYNCMDKAFNCIKQGLLYNYRNYELYLMLGNYYLKENPNKAFLCYENSEYYCTNEDKNYIKNLKEELLCSGQIEVSPVSIIILSYNNLQITKLCIDSIRQNNSSESYEIIVIDNNSKDGSAEWLLTQKDLKVVCNKENRGFPAGCNQGILLAEKKNDIFLLNNDTVVPPNAIFWLRMGLYESEKVGATGSISNFAGNNQMIEEKRNSIEEYYQYGLKNNIPMEYPYEKKVWLMGFAVLFKRSVLEEVGYLDEQFSPGNYEDNDIGLRILEAGYEQLLCKNSFIYHFGSVGFRKNQTVYDELLKKNRKKLNQKYNMEAEESSWVRTDLLQLIDKKKEESFFVLDVGCGFGATLAKIAGEFPNSVSIGIELNERAAKIGSNLVTIIQGDIEKMELYELQGMQFDYIIYGNILEYLQHPSKAIIRLIPFLKKSGKLIISISKSISNQGKICKILKDDISEMFAGCDEVIFQMEEINSNKKLDYILSGKKVELPKT